RRLVEVALEVLVEIVVVGELEHAGGADLDLVALLQLVAVDLVAVGEGPVGRARVAEQVVAIVHLDDGMGARYSLVVDAYVGLQAAADGGAIAAQGEHLPHAVAREHHDERPLLAATDPLDGVRLQANRRARHLRRTMLPGPQRRRHGRPGPAPAPAPISR